MSGAKPRGVHAIGAVLTAAALTLALAGCQSPPQQSEAPVSSSSPAASPEVVHSATPTPAPTSTQSSIMIGNDHEKYSVLGHFLVKRKFGETIAPWVSGDPEFYVIGKGALKLSGEQLLPGKGIISQFYTSIGTADKPLIAGAVKYRAPASGLDPESYVTVLLAIDPATGSVLKQTEILRTELQGNDSHGLTGSGTNAVALSSELGDFRSGTTTLNTSAFDVMTGAKLWERPGLSYGHVLGAVSVMTDGRGVTYNGDPCPQADGIDVASGKVLYNVQLSEQAPENCEHPTPTAEGDPQGTRAQPGGRYVRIGSATVASFDALTGAAAQLPEELKAVDPLSTLVAGGPGLSTVEQPIIVSDSVTGEVKYTLDGVRAAKLVAVVEALHDGKLYLKTTDQHPVIDVATGETIEPDAKRYPVGSVDKWTFWSDGYLEAPASPDRPNASTNPDAPEKLRNAAVGSWAGPVTGDSSAYTVEATIQQTASGLSAEVEYPELQCKATWKETAVSGSTISLAEGLLSGRCEDNVKVTLTQDAETWKATFSSGSGEKIQAVLRSN